MLARAGERIGAAVSLHDLAQVVTDRIWKPAFHVAIKVRSVGGQHHRPATSFHTHDLHSHRVSADMVYAQPGSDSFVAVVKNDTARKQPPDHCRDIFRI